MSGSSCAERGAAIAPRLWPSTKTRFGSMPFVLRSSADGRQGVVDHLLLDGEVLAPWPASAACCRGALLVAQHGDALAGQAPGQVAERLVGADRLVAVVRAGAVDQHHRRERAVALRQRQRRRAAATRPRRPSPRPRGTRRAWRTAAPCTRRSPCPPPRRSRSRRRPCRSATRSSSFDLANSQGTKTNALSFLSMRGSPSFFISAELVRHLVPDAGQRVLVEHLLQVGATKSLVAAA